MKAKLVQSVTDLESCARMVVGVIFAGMHVRNGQVVVFITPIHVDAANYFARVKGDGTHAWVQLGVNICVQVQRIAADGKKLF